MKTAAKPQNTRSRARKKLVVESMESAMTRIVESAGKRPGNVLREKLAAIPSGTGISNEEKRQLIAEVAYYRAEKRNFVPGYELDDWLSAEAEVENVLSAIVTPIGGHIDVDTKNRRSR